MQQSRAKPIFWAALVAGFSYMVPVLAGWDGPAIIAWKGAGVALLALWAALNARDSDGWLITAVMAFGALGDVLLDAIGLQFGAIAFVIGHVLAIMLYLRHRREKLTGSQRALALATVPGAVAISWLLLHHAPGGWHGVVYTLFVAAMAAMAWASRFPRYRTGIGAMLFLASDLLIFAREGGTLDPVIASALIWPLYFGGQAMIVWGVVTALRASTAKNPIKAAA